MARIRTIKPEFFTSLTIAGLTPNQRLTFIGLWTHADDEGLCVDDARLVRAALWALDDRTTAEVEDDLRALTEVSLIARYVVRGKRFLSVSGWSEHQKINRPTKSKFPGPDQVESEPGESLTSGNESSPNPHVLLTEDAVRAHVRKGKEQGTGNRDSATRGDESPAAESSPETTQNLVAEWIEHCDDRPPGRVVGQVSREVKTLLDEGIPFDAIRAGLAEWHKRNLNPATIASVVHEVRRGPGVRPGRQSAHQAQDDAASGKRAQQAEWRDRHGVAVIFDDDTEETVAARAAQRAGVAS